MLQSSFTSDVKTRKKKKHLQNISIKDLHKKIDDIKSVEEN